MSDRWNGKIKADEFASLQESTAKIMGLRKPVVKESHMKPEIFKGLAYSCDTTNGIEIVPQEVCGKIRGLALPGDALAEGDKNFDAAVKQLRNYLSSGSVMDIELVEGYLARLSAPGYTDSTEWGIYDSVEDAEADLAFMYGDDDDDDMDESKKPVAKEASGKKYNDKFRVKFHYMTDVDTDDEAKAIKVIKKECDTLADAKLVEVEIDQFEDSGKEGESVVVHAYLTFESDSFRTIKQIPGAYNDDDYILEDAEFQKLTNGQWNELDINAYADASGYDPEMDESKRPIKEADDADRSERNLANRDLDAEFAALKKKQIKPIEAMFIIRGGGNHRKVFTTMAAYDKYVDKLIDKYGSGAVEIRVARESKKPIIESVDGGGIEKAEAMSQKIFGMPAKKTMEWDGDAELIALCMLADAACKGNAVAFNCKPLNDQELGDFATKAKSDAFSISESDYEHSQTDSASIASIECLFHDEHTYGVSYPIYLKMPGMKFDPKDAMLDTEEQITKVQRIIAAMRSYKYLVKNLRVAMHITPIGSKPIKEADDNVTGSKPIKESNKPFKTDKEIVDIAKLVFDSALDVGSIDSTMKFDDDLWGEIMFNDLGIFEDMRVSDQNKVKAVFKKLMKTMDKPAKEMNSRPGQLRKFRGKGR